MKLDDSESHRLNNHDILGTTKFLRTAYCTYKSDDRSDRIGNNLLDVISRSRSTKKTAGGPFRVLVGQRVQMLRKKMPRYTNIAIF